MKKPTKQTPYIILWAAAVLLALVYLIYRPSFSSFLIFSFAAIAVPVLMQLFVSLDKPKAQSTPAVDIPQYPSAVEPTPEAHAEEAPAAEAEPIAEALPEPAPAAEEPVAEIPAPAEETSAAAAPEEPTIPVEEVPAAREADAEIPAMEESTAPEFLEEAADDIPAPLDLSDIPFAPVVPARKRASRAKLTEMPDLKLSNITRSTSLERLFPLVVLDVKTTGTKVVGNEIIEITAVKYDSSFHPASCFTTLCKSRKSIPEEVTAACHITDEMVQDFPAFQYIAPSLSEYIDGCHIVGCDIFSALPFLYTYGVTLPAKARYYDVLELGQKALAKSRGRKKSDQETRAPSLADLCKYYGLPADDAANALSTCCAAAAVFERVIADKRA